MNRMVYFGPSWTIALVRLVTIPWTNEPAEPWTINAVDLPYQIIWFDQEQNNNWLDYEQMDRVNNEQMNWLCHEQMNLMNFVCGYTQTERTMNLLWTDFVNKETMNLPSKTEQTEVVHTYN